MFERSLFVLVLSSLSLSRLYLLSTVYFFSVLHIIFHVVETAEH